MFAAKSVNPGTPPHFHKLGLINMGSTLLFSFVTVSCLGPRRCVIARFLFGARISESFGHVQDREHPELLKRCFQRAKKRALAACFGKPFGPATWSSRNTEQSTIWMFSVCWPSHLCSISIRFGGFGIQSGFVVHLLGDKLACENMANYTKVWRRLGVLRLLGPQRHP